MDQRRFGYCCFGSCVSPGCAANRESTLKWIASLYFEACVLLTMAALLVFMSWTDWTIVTNCALLPLHALQIDSSLRHGNRCNYETSSQVAIVGLGCYSAAWLRILTLTLDAVALSKIVYNTATSASDSHITQAVFVGVLFLMSVYRAKTFFVRLNSSTEEDVPSGHGISILLMTNFSNTVARSTGNPEEQALMGR